VTDTESTPPLTLTPGASPEAQALLERWNDQWQGVEPWRWATRDVRPEAWVRFHTLTDGRQQIRHRRDARTVRRRFRRIVRVVEDLTDLPATVILFADNPRHGPFRDRALSVLPDLESWVTDPPRDFGDDADWQDNDPEEEDEDDEDAKEWPPPTHSFTTGLVDDRLLDALIMLVHEQDEDFVILPEDLSWAISAYDGGVDVVMRDPDDATALAGWLAPWLPPDGWPGAYPWSRNATQREMHRGFGVDVSKDEGQNGTEEEDLGVDDTRPM
jgi:hypothetical protein